MGPRSLLVAPEAWGVNFADLVLISGNYYLKPPLPFVPGMEIAGTILAVGREVSSFVPGDRVAAYVEAGGYAERVIATEDASMKVPPAMSTPVAAAFPATYGTAHVALRHRARLGRGETLLVLGAAGGVGAAAVEIGRLLGARVIAAASTEEKLHAASDLGAHHLVNYSSDDLFERVMEITSGVGVNIVYDPVGGEQFDRAFRCLAFEGRMIVIGFTSAKIPSISAGRVLIKPRTVIGSSWTATLKNRPQIIRHAYIELAHWYEKGRLRLREPTIMPFTRAAEALQRLADRTAVGKIVLCDGAA